jgi:Apoptosis-antagonizing transcription factor, C-terminal
MVNYSNFLVVLANREATWVCMHIFRYNNVHEKIVNFMAPLPMTITSMVPKLFENLFGNGNQQMKTSAYVPLMRPLSKFHLIQP